MEAFATQLKYSGAVEEATQRAQQSDIFLEIYTRVLVARENYLVTALFVIMAVNHVEERPCILLGKGSVANLVNNQERKSHKAIETGVNHSGQDYLEAEKRFRSSETLMSFKSCWQ